MKTIVFHQNSYIISLNKKLKIYTNLLNDVVDLEGIKNSHFLPYNVFIKQLNNYPPKAIKNNGYY